MWADPFHPVPSCFPRWKACRDLAVHLPRSFCIFTILCKQLNGTYRYVVHSYFFLVKWNWPLFINRIFYFFYLIILLNPCLNESIILRKIQNPEVPQWPFRREYLCTWQSDQEAERHQYPGGSCALSPPSVVTFNHTGLLMVSCDSKEPFLKYFELSASSVIFCWPRIRILWF